MATKTIKDPKKDKTVFGKNPVKVKADQQKQASVKLNKAEAKKANKLKKPGTVASEKPVMRKIKDDKKPGTVASEKPKR